jgi:hypothetical protein
VTVLLIVLPGVLCAFAGFGFSELFPRMRFSYAAGFLFAVVTYLALYFLNMEAIKAERFEAKIEALTIRCEDTSQISRKEP